MELGEQAVLSRDHLQGSAQLFFADDANLQPRFEGESSKTYELFFRLHIADQGDLAFFSLDDTHGALGDGLRPELFFQARLDLTHARSLASRRIEPQQACDHEDDRDACRDAERERASRQHFSFLRTESGKRTDFFFRLACFCCGNWQLRVRSL